MHALVVLIAVLAFVSKSRCGAVAVPSPPVSVATPAAPTRQGGTANSTPVPRRRSRSLPNPLKLLPLPVMLTRSVLSSLRKPVRDAGFWARTLRIYSSYKAQQLKNRMRRPRGQQTSLFNATHEVNSRRMLDLCMTMRGFYLKTGQFLATRHDFMPPQYTERLARLQDDVPPMSASEARKILERELKGPLSTFFSSIDLEKPIGSASIAQVHRAVWRNGAGGAGLDVAVKIQYPTAERLMRGDLRNLRTLAEFLQRTELKFDLLSAIKELQRQIGNEFDFIREGNNMEEVGEKLRKLVPEVQVPRLVYSTKRVLVMTFLPGDNLRKMAEYRGGSGDGGVLAQVARQRAGKKLVETLAKAWGNMIFRIRKFQADPHPGNIVLSGGRPVGLLDWGQVKIVDDKLAGDFSTLVMAMKSQNEDAICDALFALGVCVADATDRATVKAIALTMLDTRRVPGYIIDPFDPRNTLKKNSVTKMPADLYFVVRTVQLLRGICFAFDIDFSLADSWAPLAKETLLALDVAKRL